MQSPFDPFQIKHFKALQYGPFQIPPFKIQLLSNLASRTATIQSFTNPAFQWPIIWRLSNRASPKLIIQLLSNPGSQTPTSRHFSDPASYTTTRFKWLYIKRHLLPWTLSPHLSQYSSPDKDQLMTFKGAEIFGHTAPKSDETSKYLFNSSLFGASFYEEFSSFCQPTTDGLMSHVSKSIIIPCEKVASFAWNVNISLRN